MSHTDERIDQYIAEAEDFAQPILRYIRDLVHQVCPTVVETIKWSFPHFEYGGKILCSMAAFKTHCAFSFRMAEKINDPDRLLQLERGAGMGHFGKITAVHDLPGKKVFAGFIREAMALNEAGVSRVRSRSAKKTALEVPKDLLKKLKEHKAESNFNDFSYSHRKEYIEWINEAKSPETRDKRITTAAAWIAENKPRNWKYMRK